MLDWKSANVNVLIPRFFSFSTRTIRNINLLSIDTEGMTTYIHFGMAALLETVAAVLRIMAVQDKAAAPTASNSIKAAGDAIEATLVPVESRTEVVEEPASSATSFTVMVLSSDYTIMPYKVSGTTTLAELRVLIQNVKRIAPCQMRLAYKGQPLGGVPGDSGYAEMESVPLNEVSTRHRISCEWQAEILQLVRYRPGRPAPAPSSPLVVTDICSWISIHSGREGVRTAWNLRIRWLYRQELGVKVSWTISEALPLAIVLASRSFGE